MNSGTARLFRYFERLSGDVNLSKALQKSWPNLPAKNKGKITSWMEKVCATLTAIKEDKKAREKVFRENREKANLDILKGFI